MLRCGEVSYCDLGYHTVLYGRDSSVIIVTINYRPVYRGIGVRIQTGVSVFSSSQHPYRLRGLPSLQSFEHECGVGGRGKPEGGGVNLLGREAACLYLVTRLRLCGVKPPAPHYSP